MFPFARVVYFASDFFPSNNLPRLINNSICLIFFYSSNFSICHCCAGEPIDLFIHNCIYILACHYIAFHYIAQLFRITLNCLIFSSSDLVMCPSGWINCSRGECILPSFSCNGNWDCWDGTDEKNCSKLENIFDSSIIWTHNIYLSNTQITLEPNFDPYDPWTGDLQSTKYNLVIKAALFISIRSTICPTFSSFHSDFRLYCEYFMKCRMIMKFILPHHLISRH